jgi:UDP:flavonoid glycosyltransferase YjiC (YdhE family)
MAKILICCELGGNLGHLSRQRAIGKALQSEGHEVVFAASDLTLAKTLLEPDGLHYIPAPIAPAPPPRSPPIANLSEILLQCGYSDSAALANRVREWIEYIESFRIDLLLTDYAPTAVIAGMHCKRPVVAISNGFDIPSDDTPLRNPHQKEAFSKERRLLSDRRLVDHINQCLVSLGSATRAASLLSLYSGVTQIFATYPELDHYGSRQHALYIGPIYNTESGQDYQWPEGSGPRVLGYIRRTIGSLAPIAQALRNIGSNAICAAPDISAAQCDAYSSRTVRLVPHTLPTAALIGDATLCLCMGGLGTIAPALRAGVPLALFPRNCEQYMQSQRVVEIGAGLIVSPDSNTSDISRLLDSLISERRYKSAAIHFALSHGDDSVSRSISSVSTIISGLQG